MSKLSAKIKEEIEALIPPTLFFFFALHVVALVRALLLKATGLAPATSVSIAIAALILGKAVLLADLLPFINRYPRKPLIYNVAWKTVIYVLISVLIHYLERLFDFWRATGGFVAANEKLLAEIVWPHFWAIQILLLMLILTYCTMREFARAVGEQKMLRMFFGPIDGRAGS